MTRDQFWRDSFKGLRDDNESGCLNSACRVTIKVISMNSSNSCRKMQQQKKNQKTLQRRVSLIGTKWPQPTKTAPDQRFHNHSFYRWGPWNVNENLGKSIFSRVHSYSYLKWTRIYLIWWMFSFSWRPIQMILCTFKSNQEIWVFIS